MESSDRPFGKRTRNPTRQKDTPLGKPFGTEVFAGYLFVASEKGLFVEVRPACERVFSVIIHSDHAVSDDFFFFKRFELLEGDFSKLLAIDRGILIFFFIVERERHMPDGKGLISYYDIQKLVWDKYFADERLAFGPFTNFIGFAHERRDFFLRHSVKERKGSAEFAVDLYRDGDFVVSEHKGIVLRPGCKVDGSRISKRFPELFREVRSEGMEKYGDFFAPFRAEFRIGGNALVQEDVDGGDGSVEFKVGNILAHLLDGLMEKLHRFHVVRG